jgi:hypothetical protein
MHVYNNHKTTVFQLLFDIKVLGMNRQDKCDTVNNEYTVANRKYDHSTICSVILIDITSTKHTPKFL